MKANLYVSSSSPRRMRERALAATLAFAVIIATLKLADSALLLAIGAVVGATMLTTAFFAREAPRPEASKLTRATYLLTFGLVDAMAALDELARLPRP